MWHACGRRSGRRRSAGASWGMARSWSRTSPATGGPKPQHRGAGRAGLDEAAAWIRRRSRQLREECAVAGVAYVDVGELGFEAAMLEARRVLLGRG